MNAFEVNMIFNVVPNKRYRTCFALGMRDSRLNTWDGEARVNDGYEDDAYWAGRMLRSSVKNERNV